MAWNFGCGGGTISVPSDQIFNSEAERDAYFTSNPAKLFEGAQCVITTNPPSGLYQVYSSGAWEDRSNLIRGEGAPDAASYSGFVNGWIGPNLPVITQDNATQLSISAGDFVGIDYTTPATPSINKISYSGVTGYTPIYLNDVYATSYLYINAATGLLVENLSPPKGHDANLIYIGNLDFTTTTTQNDTLLGVNPFIETAYSTAQTQNRIQFSRGSYNLDGCVYGATTGLILGHSAGHGIRVGANTINDTSNPDVVATALNAITAVVRGYINGSGNIVNDVNFAKEVNPTQKVINGSLVGVALNKYTVQYIYHFYGSDFTFVYYSDVEENTLAEAKAKVMQGGPINKHPITSEAQLRAALIVRGGATNLNVAADAEFIELG